MREEAGGEDKLAEPLDDTARVKTKEEAGGGGNAVSSENKIFNTKEELSDYYNQCIFKCAYCHKARG